MKTSDIALLLPGEAYSFAKSVVWAMLLFLAGCYLRQEIKAVISEVAKLIARIRKIKYEQPGKIELEILPPEDFRPLPGPLS